MTQGDVKVFETDVVLYPVKSDEEVLSKETETEVVEVKKRVLKVDINKRFARFRKSIRRRSASIF